jgi:hypothetical protein
MERLVAEPAICVRDGTPFLWPIAPGLDILTADVPLRARLDQVRRRLEEVSDQTWATARWKLGRRGRSQPFDGDPRFAIVTVNFSTTRFLKLLLLTLTEQTELALVQRIVIVDNASRDGGAAFGRALAARVPRVHLVENRRFTTHAHGMRLGLRALDAIDPSPNIVLSCDTDVIFRRPDALTDLARVFVETGAAAAGELRTGLYPYPEAQASFLAVRRDIYARADIAPWVNHGAPAYWLQRSIWKAGLTIAHFPSNEGGYVLHRGRSGVAAAGELSPWSSYARVEDREPHYMGIADGAKIWRETEERWAELLRPEGEEQCLARLVRALSLGERVG